MPRGPAQPVVSQGSLGHHRCPPTRCCDRFGPFRHRVGRVRICSDTGHSHCTFDSLYNKSRDLIALSVLKRQVKRVQDATSLRVGSLEEIPYRTETKPISSAALLTQGCLVCEGSYRNFFSNFLKLGVKIADSPWTCMTCSRVPIESRVLTPNPRDRKSFSDFRTIGSRMMPGSAWRAISSSDSVRK